MLDPEPADAIQSFHQSAFSACRLVSSVNAASDKTFVFFFVCSSFISRLFSVAQPVFYFGEDTR